MTKISTKLRKLQDSKKQAPHVIINALAGTGKTTTLIEGLNYMKGCKPRIEPSPQQQAIWELLAASKGAKSVAFCAFNKSIATELGRRVPEGCVAMTLHSMGNKAVSSALGRYKVDPYPAADHLSNILGIEFRELRKTEFDLIRHVDRLMSLCKMNLTGFVDGHLLPEDDPQWSEELDELATHHDLELNGQRDRVFELVPKVLHRCLDPKNASSISFDDMIWLPVVLNLPVTKYDLLLVDECQDLNRCQQVLALRAGHRLVFCGDVHQAIYGFAGADALSMQRLEETLLATDRGCVVLPLTVTRRCGRAIVQEAQTIVAAFEAHESNGDGLISRAVFKQSEAGNAPCYRDTVAPGDMLICRVNAPLVSECFKFIKAGHRAEIQGRDIGKGLLSLIDKMKADSVEDLIAKITDWEHTETDRENKKRKPSEARIISIQDRADCIICFTEGTKCVEEVKERIQNVFTDEDEGNAIRLSSIHKAKGLEADRVFLLEPERCTVPHPMAKTDWQIGQEWNLRYVAITRAIKELVYVK